MESSKNSLRKQVSAQANANSLAAEPSWRQSQVFTHATEAIFIKDLVGHVVDMNPAAERQYGWSREELIGKSIKTLVPPDEHQERDELMARCVQGEEIRGVEGTRITKSGEVRAVLLSLSLLTDDLGQPAHIMAFSEEITERKRTEQALYESRERIRAIFNVATDAIITIDQRGIITDANPATERMFGYAGGELIGQNVSILMPPPYRDEHDGYIKRYLETGKAQIIGVGREVTAKRKDGSVFPISLAVSEVDHLLMFVGMIHDISARKELERYLAESRSDEKRYLSQELHDGLGSLMTGIAMLAQTLHLKMSRTGLPEADQVADLVKHIREAHEQVRRISRGLLPVEVVPGGLRAALRELAKRTSKADKLDCKLVVRGEVAIRSPNDATHLYRIAQEAVSNAVRHGRPSEIVLGLEADGCLVRLSVRDNGIGIQESPDGRKGMGLRTMKYRAEQIGATLTVAPAESDGTVVTCTYPIEASGG